MRTRTYVALVLALVLGPVLCPAAGPRTSCRVPVGVVVNDLSRLSSGERAEALASWKKWLGVVRYSAGWHYARPWTQMSWHLSYRRERLVVMPGGRAIPGPPGKWLMAYRRTFLGRRRPATIESVTVNRSPRRIVFVAENGPEMTAAAGKIESAVITGIVSKARPEDSFALLTAGGPPIALHFGASRARLLAAAEELCKTPPAAAESEGVRDALLEATKWFHGHQPGDAIFVLAMALEGPAPGFFGTLRDAVTLGLAQTHQASFGKVRAAVLRRHIRVFGFQLGSPYYNPPACPVSMCGVTVRPNESNEATYFGSGGGSRMDLILLCAASFGQFASSDTQRVGYKLTAARLADLKSYAEIMYRMAIKYYVLGLSSTSKKLVIGLKPSVLNQFPGSFAFYPPDIPSCSSR